jgi:hypothetical protein
MRVARILLGGAAALVVLFWIASLATNAGVLVWSSTPYQDDIYNYDLVVPAPPTYEPAGRLCTYLTYGGTRDVFFVGTGEREYIAARIAAGEDIDAWVLSATIATTTDWSEECPATFKFETR